MGPVEAQHSESADLQPWYRNIDRMIRRVTIHSELPLLRFRGYL